MTAQTIKNGDPILQSIREVLNSCGIQGDVPVTLSITNNQSGEVSKFEIPLSNGNGPAAPTPSDNSSTPSSDKLSSEIVNLLNELEPNYDFSTRALSNTSSNPQEPFTASLSIHTDKVSSSSLSLSAFSNIEESFMASSFNLCTLKYTCDRNGCRWACM